MIFGIRDCFGVGLFWVGVGVLWGGVVLWWTCFGGGVWVAFGGVALGGGVGLGGCHQILLLANGGTSFAHRGWHPKNYAMKRSLFTVVPEVAKIFRLELLSISEQCLHAGLPEVRSAVVPNTSWQKIHHVFACSVGPAGSGATFVEARPL